MAYLHIPSYLPTLDLRSPSLPTLRHRAHYFRYSRGRHLSAPRASYSALVSSPTSYLREDALYQNFPTTNSNRKTDRLTPRQIKRGVRNAAVRVNTHFRCARDCTICYPDLTKGIERVRRAGKEWSGEGERLCDILQVGEVLDDGGEEGEEEVPVRMEEDWGCLVDRALERAERREMMEQMGEGGMPEGFEWEWELLSDDEEADSWEIVSV